MNVARGLVLVRAVDTEETLGGGRVILTQKSRENLTAHQMIVVDMGMPEICDDEDCQRPHCEGWDHPPGGGEWRVVPTLHHQIPNYLSGSWVLVRPRSLVDAGSYPDRQYFVRQDDVLAVFEVA